MELKTNRRQVIREVPWGMLVWRTDDGEIVGNDEGFMHIFLTDTDPAKMEKAKIVLGQAARGFGIEGGRPVFWQGRRPIDAEELEHQLARAEAGLVPDPLDIAAINEEAKALKLHNG